MGLVFLCLWGSIVTGIDFGRVGSPLELLCGIPVSSCLLDFWCFWPKISNIIRLLSGHYKTLIYEERLRQFVFALGARVGVHVEVLDPQKEVILSRVKHLVRHGGWVVIRRLYWWFDFGFLGLRRLSWQRLLSLSLLCTFALLNFFACLASWVHFLVIIVQWWRSRNDLGEWISRSFDAFRV